MPGDDQRVYASMGNYIFSTRTLLRLLREDAADENSRHDFGHDILPRLAGKGEMYAYDFQTNRIPGEPPDAVPYWRDVGTIDAYYEANMDLRSITPALNLYNREWPLRTRQLPGPAGQVHLRRRQPPRAGHRLDRLRRMHSLGRHGAQLRAGPRRPRALRRAGGGLRDPGQLRYRPPRQAPPRHPGQERARARGRHHRLRPGARPRRAPSSPRAASWWWPAAARPVEIARLVV